MNLVHKETGERKFLSRNWRSVFEDIMRDRGFVHVHRKLKNEGKEGILIIRHTGGMGDILCIIPVVRWLSGMALDLTVCFPSEFEFFFKEIPRVKFIPYESVNYLNIVSQFGQIYDMYCPCADYEDSMGYLVQKSRTENFAEFIDENVEISGNIEFPHSMEWKDRTNKIILIQAISACRSKDLPTQVLVEVYQRMSKYGHTFFVDKENVLGYPTLVGLSTEQLSKAVYNADLVIALDSGILHLAGVLDVPTIGIFGPTNGVSTCKHYPSVRVIQLNKNVGCPFPCYYSTGLGFHCAKVVGDCMHTLDVNKLEELAYNILQTPHAL